MFMEFVYDQTLASRAAEQTSLHVVPDINFHTYTMVVHRGSRFYLPTDLGIIFLYVWEVACLQRNMDPSQHARSPMTPST